MLRRERLIQDLDQLTQRQARNEAIRVELIERYKFTQGMTLEGVLAALRQTVKALESAEFMTTEWNKEETTP